MELTKEETIQGLAKLISDMRKIKRMTFNDSRHLEDLLLDLYILKNLT